VQRATPLRRRRGVDDRGEERVREPDASPIADEDAPLLRFDQCLPPSPPSATASAIAAGVGLDKAAAANEA
jgi:hypothetical protein